ncbi:MAG: hypothetical protein ABRQ26_05915, partial [Syntrophomonadaceae bacterium]
MIVKKPLKYFPCLLLSILIILTFTSFASSAVVQYVSTAIAPTVATLTPAANISKNSADIRGDVTSENGGSVAERGIYLSNTNSTP